MKSNTQEILKDISENLKLSVRGRTAYIRDTKQKRDVMQFNPADLAKDNAEMPRGKYFLDNYDAECRKMWIEEKIGVDYSLDDKVMFDERVIQLLKSITMDKWPDELLREKEKTEQEYYKLRAEHNYEYNLPEDIAEKLDNLRRLMIIYEDIANDVKDVSDFFRGTHPAPMTAQQIRDISVGMLPNQASPILSKGSNPQVQNANKEQKAIPKTLNNPLANKNILLPDDNVQQKPVKKEFVAPQGAHNPAPAKQPVARVDIKPQPKASPEHPVTIKLTPHINCFAMSFGEKGGFTVPEIKDFPAIYSAVSQVLKTGESIWTKTRGKDDYNVKAVFKDEDGKLRQKDKDISLISGLFEVGTIPGLHHYKLKKGQVVLVNDVKCRYAGEDKVVFAETQEQCKYRDYEYNKEGHPTNEGSCYLKVSGNWWHTSNGLTNYGDLNLFGATDFHKDSDLKISADHFNMIHNLTKGQDISVTFYALGEHLQEPDQPEKYLLNRYHETNRKFVFHEGDILYHKIAKNDLAQGLFREGRVIPANPVERFDETDYYNYAGTPADSPLRDIYARVISIDRENDSVQLDCYSNIENDSILQALRKTITVPLSVYEMEGYFRQANTKETELLYHKVNGYIAGNRDLYGEPTLNARPAMEALSVIENYMEKHTKEGIVLDDEGHEHNDDQLNK